LELFLSFEVLFSWRPRCIFWLKWHASGKANLRT
jgi:hypothetical protein